MPGLDGEKMSASKPHTSIFLSDDLKTIKKKINRAFSGGQPTAEEHRKLGGNPDVDIAYNYLDALFLDRKTSKKVHDDYKKGKILAGEMKALLYKHVEKIIKPFQNRYSKLTNKHVDKCLIKF
jgi:tryptophanyl-tRNA synthetase